MKNKRLFMFSCFCASVLFACGGEDPAEEDNGIPPTDAQPIPAINSNNFDGHYNAGFKVTKSTCGDSYFSPTYEKIDFVSYGGKKGMVVFDNKFYWSWVDVELKDDGSFEKTIPAEAFFFFTNYWGYELKLAGKFKDGYIEGTAKDTVYTGVTEELTAYCYMDHSFSGYKRFKTNSTAPKSLEGEYKTKIAKTKNNNCPGQSLLDNYFVTLVRAQKNNYDLMVDTQWLPGLSIAGDGAIDATYDNNGVHYTLKGKISPESLSLDLAIKWDSYKCAEDYSLTGKKRFEEADGKDTTLDGIYAIWAEVESNTCSKETDTKKYHMNVQKTGDGKARIVMANKEFATATIDSNGSLNASYDDGFGYTSLNTFKGTLTSNKMDASLTIDVAYKFNGKDYSCGYKYKIIGEKLYKHN